MSGIAAAASKALDGLFPPQSLKAKWQRIDSPPLPRSSHSLSVVAGRAYVFGGEITAREPVDNDMHIFTLPAGTVTSADYRSIPARSEEAGGDVPEKRVGHTAAVIGERIFVFGGRGGKDMKPLQENGRVWIYNTRTDAWTYLDPMPDTPFPEARSYHSTVAIEKPEPQSKGDTVKNATAEPQPGAIAEQAQTDQGMGGHGTLFIHAGCPPSGRKADLWGFDVQSRTWKEFPTAPGNPRGGTSITVSKQRIYRYGGFNGEGEEGGKLDILELSLNTFNDKGGRGEMAVAAKGAWQTLNFDEESVKSPGPRSVAGFHSITTVSGREYLVLFLGERDPSSQGHDGAGKFYSDVWAFEAPPLGMTSASLQGAILQSLGKETGEGLWTQLPVSDSEGAEGDDVKGLTPGERGWFASAPLGDLDVDGIMLWGGLNGKNEREDNGWFLSLR